jgi:TetR/AcrR family transcriptional regulator, cholesterol catabolism regulator
MFRSVPLLVLANFCYLERIDLPTLIVHGDDDQLVPIDASARRSAEPVKDTTLKVYPGGAARAGPGCPAIVLAILQERGFLPEMRRLLAGAPDRPAEVVLPELAAGFHRLLAEHGELVALYFAAGRANPAVRAGLQEFVAEGQQLLADHLTTRVAAGELRPHDTRATAHLLLSTVAFDQITGVGPDPAAVVDVLLHGLTTTPDDSPEREGR